MEERHAKSKNDVAVELRRLRDVLTTLVGKLESSPEENAVTVEKNENDGIAESSSDTISAVPIL